MRTSLPKPLAIAAIGTLVGLIVNSAAAYFTDWTNAAAWFAAPFIAVVVAMAQALVSAVADQSGGHRHPRTSGYSSHYSSDGTSLLVVVATLVGLGALAFAATAGVRYAVGWYTGNETGPERLSAVAVGGSGGLGVTVSSLQQTPHFTRAEVTVDNQTGVSVSLPLFGFCTLTGGDGTTLKADAFRSDWSTDLAPGGKSRGVIVFSGHLPDDAREATLAWATVFAAGPRSCLALFGSDPKRTL